ncbi:MAG TPA: DUF4147 domain-containing protein [Candidatus Paceibacterota bacterium]|nr:DUF4147 domain-containing protein [Candidatus Paceibacterota bacterium]
MFFSKSIILNKKSLAVSKMRKDALEIIESAYEAIDIEKTTRKRFYIKGSDLFICDLGKKEKIDLSLYNRIFAIGFGKGSYAAVSVIADVLGKRLYGAIALDTKTSCKPAKPNKNVDIYWGTHPRPSKANVEATSTIVSVVSDLKENDLVIYFTGGGGSSLLCGSLDEMEHSSLLFKELTRQGASITELNIVRKHLSLVKGGNLAKLTYPATSVSLFVSDVCGNDLSTIASGPTVFDSSTINDAISVLNKYKIPFDNIDFIETPKEKHYFDKCKYFILACNEDAALAMVETARKLGYYSNIESLSIQGEARDVFLPELKKIKEKSVLVMAGETVITLMGSGVGGRNQEACLGVLAQAYKKEISLDGLLVSSFASDGYDNTPIAGAIVDALTLKKVFDKKIDPVKNLENDDSYELFIKLGDFIEVERRAFNVSDLMLIIKE